MLLFLVLRSRMSLRGVIAVISVMRDSSLMSINFDLVLRSTTGYAPPLSMANTIVQLEESGFSGVKKMKLALGQLFYRLMARAA